MKANTLDAFVYVQVPQAKQQKSDIVTALSELSGVVRASANAYVGKLVDIAYDPATTSSSRIIEYVRSRGYHGFMVGL